MYGDINNKNWTFCMNLYIIKQENEFIESYKMYKKGKGV